MKKAMSDDKAEICQRCGNIYLLIWLKPGDDYNDFGLRHCPYCGLLIDELTGSVVF
jgi:DNA-directed RNA polymerase subunit RPC12/RpoP